MKSKTTLLVVILMLAMALGAGVVAGKLSARLPAPTGTGAKEVSLTEALQLTPEQQQKMRAIWEGVRDEANRCMKEADQAQKDQDDKLLAILSDDQKAKFQQFNNERIAKITALNQKRKDSFKKAVDDTN